MRRARLLQRSAPGFSNLVFGDVRVVAICVICVAAICVVAGNRLSQKKAARKRGGVLALYDLREKS
jgi:hypothetical protein